VELVPRTSIVRATWRALLEPRRLLPVLVAAGPMVWAQAKWSRDPLALPLGVVVVVTFLLVAPVSYRVLFPDGLDLSHGAVRLVLYALVGAGVMLTLCVGVPLVLRMDQTFLTDRTSVFITTAFFLVGGWGLGRDIGMEQRLARLQQEADRAQLLALKAHLDPHFLFNTLNAIAEWCRIDGEVAERAVLSLSALLRTMLDGVRAPLWPLEREVALARRLLELHLLRDKALFTLEERLPDPLPQVGVPPMCLTTLVENAIKHGPAAGHRGVITLEASVAGGALRLSLENPGPFTGAREGSVGLPTLAQHLRVAYGAAAQLEVAAAGPGRTRATLTLPITEPHA
jgi:signal transduction histidine kinase